METIGRHGPRGPLARRALYCLGLLAACSSCGSDDGPSSRVAATGGAPEGTGASGTGGVTGGINATGGMATGGMATGGVATGGMATGGVGAGVGGASTGGELTGGLDTGGAPTGGAPTGGTASGGGGMTTGGVPTGGMPTGGVSTGGAPTGGVSTGGVSTGGMPTGGVSTGGQGAGASGGIFNPPYILGADISWTLEQESQGRHYVDGGVTKSVERIFVDHGFNFVRLRTFVCPGCPDGYASVSSAGTSEAWCDTEHTIEMAKRVKACKMGLFLDFHMSDTWASIGEQHVPSAWAGMSPTEMQGAAYDYCKGVLEQMVAAGAKPDMVQVGNEINSHMSGVSINDWAAFSGLINAGIRAVRDTDPNIIVWAQHGRPRPDGNFTPWVDAILGNAPPLDVDGICGSTYGTTNNGQDWVEQFGYVIDTYGLPVMSCEYTDNRRDLINPIMHDFANGMGRGTFLWEPTAYGDGWGSCSELNEIRILA